MKKSLLLLALSFSTLAISQGKHRLSVLSGVVQNDGGKTSLTNYKRLNSDQLPTEGMFLNSLGFEYKFLSSHNFWLSSSFNKVNESYLTESQGMSRVSIFVDFKVGKTLTFSDKLNLDYGVGMVSVFTNGEMILRQNNQYVSKEFELIKSLGLTSGAVLNYHFSEHFSLFGGLNIRAYLYGNKGGESMYVPKEYMVRDGFTLHTTFDLGVSVNL